jgi:NADH:ubiquinone oxidoreductase subunit 5 (subunit L)/multisubunit Na+/H+ antiporter MnhA subunit
LNKWWFDELYDTLFVQPVLRVSREIARVDRRWIDGFLDGLARAVRTVADYWEWIADRLVVDGSVNFFARRTYGLGSMLRQAQTGSLRQYVMFIVIGTVVVFALTSFWRYAFAQ